LVLGIFLGAFGGISLGFFSEYIDHTFKKPEDVEKILNLPVITAIPAMGLTSGKERKASLPLPNFKEEHDITPSLYGNYEAIYNHILSMIDNSNDPQLTLLITSCHRGEGVSTVVANLAVSLTHHTNGRVLVVDASIHFPSMQQIFGTKKAPGLTDISSNVSIAGDIFQPTMIKNLDVLVAGQGSTKPSLLFESKQLADLITLAKREYSFILFDVPTLNDVTSAIRLTKYADGVILVIEAEKTRWEVVQRTNEMLRQAKANILGVVLNKRKFYIPASIYRTL
jgi:capsular exopolysaccharide synthesis family protein